jgi:alkanesulfonate monooxygenase SsuD/methylene tetrahydromethanopterin reductase-like flavin-dependent oxidoreductase (luciferase family)
LQTTVRLVLSLEGQMHYGLYLPNFEPWGSARIIADLAREAEDSGWDGLFLWDDVAGSEVDLVDPWVALSAAAVATSRIRLGALITPLPRRRPWKFARETVSLDHLSGGRLVVGVGTGGGEAQWTDFGEEPDHKLRGDMLDEALEIVTALWTGEPYHHDGPHYHIKGTRFLPAALQKPRIPIWVGGIWPNKRPLARMARWDGMYPLFFSAQSPAEALDQFKQAVNTVLGMRQSPAPFDVIALGATPTGQPEDSAAIIQPWAEAGATWWLESIGPLRMGKTGDPLWTFDMLRARVLDGPPRI